MEYKEKIKEYRAKFKDEKILIFVDSLSILFDWLDGLYKIKRLRKEQEKEISQYFPEEVLIELDKISSEEIGVEEYDRLKGIMLKEFSELINFIINIGNLKMTDFDLLQFNLAGIFKKEEITTMIEWARQHLSAEILERKDEEIKEQEARIRAQEIYLEKMRSMPQKEITKLIIQNMFDFSPKARSNEERIEAIKNNQNKMLSQREKFDNFERKLIDASLDAKADAQNMVYRKVGEISREINVQADKFREKARQIVSEEGIKKEMEKARNNVIDSKKKLHKNIEDKGKEWEKAQSRILNKKEQLTIEIKDKGKTWKDDFRHETEKARGGILLKKNQLIEEIKDKGKTWKDDFRQETEKARGKIFEDQKHLSAEQTQLRSLIQEKGKSEILSAREMVLQGKSDFKANVQFAKQTFSGVAGEMDKARSSFIEKRDIASIRFTSRGQEIETEIYGEIYKGKRNFEKERDSARERFAQKAGEISQKAESHISEKREKFSIDREKAGQRFLAKSQEIRVPEKILDMPKNKFEGEKLTVAAKKAESRISSVHNAMMEKAQIGKEGMIKEIIHRKELFLYDVRFARDKLQKRAKSFAEEIAGKREEFETRQQQVLARHKSHRKAMMIQNLLRTIRNIH